MIKKILNKIRGRKTDVMSFRQGYDLTELPIITLYQGDKKLNFLLDTGSNNSIIDKSVIKDLEYKTTESQSDLSGLGAVKTRVPIYEVTLNHDDQYYTYQYLIADMKGPFDDIKNSTGVALHGILGSKFFDEFRYVLDFVKMVAYSKK